MIVDFKRQYIEDGYIHANQLTPSHQMDQMRSICEYTLCQFRILDPIESTENIGDKIRVMRHLNHPGYFMNHEDWLVTMLNFIAHPSILKVAEEVLGSQPVFRCTSLFFSPLVGNQEGGWHRDSQFTTDSEEADKALVLAQAKDLKSTGTSRSIQLQVPLVPSDDVQYVPKSHLRWDNDEEYYIRLKFDQKNNRSEMPNAIRPHVSPGDIVAFNPFGLHRGRYYSTKYRRTLMLTYTSLSEAEENAKEPDRFNRQPWILKEGYLDGVEKNTKEFFDLFIQIFQNTLK